MAPAPTVQAGAADLAATTTRAQAQRSLAGAFADAGLKSAQLDARLLLCAVLAIDHAGLIRDPHLPLGAAATPLSAFAARRLRHEPVSRILGRTEFWGLPFVVTPDVLDPRPDTEAVVEAVLDALGPQRSRPLRLLDLGTGSGALLCALLHECPHAYGIGVDRSFAACRVAEANMRALGFEGRGAIVQGFWGAGLAGPFDVVVANPPYISHAELVALEPEVAGYDPPDALDGGADGLDPYRVIVPELPRLLAPGGFAALEGGWTQSQAIEAAMRASGLETIGVRRDLGGHERVVFGRRTGEAT
ncbi:peptide chain release factor N(5)-glutamine methyltransferase [Beijerinckia sp. L45]|uniref:peptide chain release factor N(5)-glutamine methyltransferase n=1 Tax=Beijerinckia sp. L45 TaxID=1641855 RepID=UPI001FEEFDBB|nr:peptide chain release factor N(5)-glutamine methyltransferase [Beijerinckia sp. L45]